MIPVIQRLRLFPVRIILASDGAALHLLRETFPGLEWVRLPFPRVKYFSEIPVWLSILIQLPVIFYGILRERRLAKVLVRRYGAGILISDNRFGLGIKNIHTVYVTHQVSVRFPFWFSFMEYAIYRLHRWIISGYDRCWIPDHAYPPDLSGELSHRYPPPPNALFIGHLSHFAGLTRISTPPETCWDIAVVLSGPEPQRSVFERMVLKQLGKHPLACILVRGSRENKPPEVEGNTRIIPLLTNQNLLDVIEKSRLLICRSGYTSLMDLVYLGKRAVLVPTPGQTEQEYLATYMKRIGAFYSMHQKEFCLETALRESAAYHPGNLQRNDSLLQKEIEKLLEGFL